MIIITGSLRGRADTLAELLESSREHALRSRGEPGCLEFGLMIDSEDPLRLVFVERWADQAALGVHMKVPAAREFGKRVAALIDQPPELNMYDASELKR